jgi:hypothetical protein
MMQDDMRRRMLKEFVVANELRPILRRFATR